MNTYASRLFQRARLRIKPIGVVCLLAGTTAFLSACSAEGPPAGDEYYDPTDEPLAPHAFQSFEEFQATVRVKGIPEELYLVEWDVPIHSVSELRAYYDANVGGSKQKGIVATLPSGADDVWSGLAQLNLSYCVSNDFGADQNRAITEMAAATRAWMDVANVFYVYNPSQNANCSNVNPNVTFSVRPWTGGGACAFRPGGSACVARTLVINYLDLDTNPFYANNAPNVTTTGVLRHELGHTLGLRHEHTRPETGGICFEDSAWRVLTPYDQSSVMHYPWCNGLLMSELLLTESDGFSARQLYGMPAAWHEPTTLWVAINN
jgi:hypothetical protein